MGGDDNDDDDDDGGDDDGDDDGGGDGHVINYFVNDTMLVGWDAFGKEDTHTRHIASYCTPYRTKQHQTTP